MKFNKWTLGLAAVGAVSLASAARADEKMSQVQTALSNTTISGYVDTSIQWNPGTGDVGVAPVSFQNSSKADGFNLNVVDLALDKPLDESPWAAGYHVELWMGPDANTLGTLSNPFLNLAIGNEYGVTFPNNSYYYGGLGGSDFAIRQAYVGLRTPIASTGIDWKLGVFDSPLGYESTSSPNNPFYTRSYGYSIEPSELTGLMGTFKVSDMLSITAGIANTTLPWINQRAQNDYYNEYTGYSNYAVKAESFKTYFGAVSLTAPDAWGWLSGSTLTAGVVNGYNSQASYYGGVQTSWYVGATLATPVKGLKAGFAWDYENIASASGSYNFYQWTAALYATYQINDKLSISARGDYWKNWYDYFGTGSFNNLWSLTGDVQYNLWQNVITRVEARWDHADHSTPFGGTIPYYDAEDGAAGYASYDGTYPNRSNAFMIALQVIYQF